MLAYGILSTMQKITDILRQRLLALMETRDLKGRELAEKAEIHAVTISKILNNKMPQVSLDIVHKLAIALEVTIEDLVGGKDLYPEHEKKITILREQFEKYGYDSIDAVIEMIPGLSKRIQDVKTDVRKLDDKFKQQQEQLKKRYGKEKKSKDRLAG